MKTPKKFKALSDEFDREFSGTLEKTNPLTAEDKKWITRALGETGPKVPVTIRLRRWQIDKAKEIAEKRHLRGYQTLIDQILTKALL